MLSNEDGSQWRIQGGGLGSCPPPPVWSLFLFFYKSEVYEQKHNIKRVRNLSQNAGNGHFRDSNSQKFMGEHADPPRKLVPSALMVPRILESLALSPGSR